MITFSEDLDAASKFTDDEDYTLGDYSGYEVRVVNLDKAQEGVAGFPVYYVVDHVETGRGLGSYATLMSVDAAVAEDREFLAATHPDDVPISAGSDLAWEREQAALDTTNGDDTFVPVVVPDAPQEETSNITPLRT